MTKFFVMRECDNILSVYLCAVTTVFSQQDGIYGFKFLTSFFGDLLQRSHSFVSLTNLKDLITNPTFGIDALSLCICMAHALHAVRHSNSQRAVESLHMVGEVRWWMHALAGMLKCLHMI
jgi:hypothetical protein